MMDQLFASGITLGRRALALTPIARGLPLGLAACLFLASGCGASSEADAAREAPTGGSGGAGAEALPSSLAFDPAEALTLFPGEARTLVLRATPPGAYDVRFALLGDPKNASLDRSEVVTEADGSASVRVTAPTSPTTFSIRASAGATVSAQAAVSVSDSGFVVLQVDPSYAGARAISYWVASVRTGTTCSALTGNPPPDGDLLARSLVEQPPQIQGVPVGPALAVTLRAGFFASGCADVPQVKADQVNHVTVTVVDRPLQLSETNLDVSLGIESAASDWQASLAASIDEAASAMRGTSPDEVAALLDAMKLASADSQAFTLARTVGAWDELMRVTFGTAPFRSWVTQWMTAGIQALDGADVFTGGLVSAGQDSGLAILTLGTVAGVDAKAAGFSALGVQGTWKADPGDTVLFGTKLFWTPSRLVTALALAPAREEVSAAASVADALASKLSCEALANLMTTATVTPGTAFASCDTSCVEQLCVSAVETLWARAREASGFDAAALQVALTGRASIDESARPVGFNGRWVGSLGAGATSASVSGPALGAAPPPPN